MGCKRDVRLVSLIYLHVITMIYINSHSVNRPTYTDQINAAHNPVKCSNTQAMPTGIHITWKVPPPSACDTHRTHNNHNQPTCTKASKRECIVISGSATLCTDASKRECIVISGLARSTLAFVHSMANRLTILSGLLASVHSVLPANPLITIHSGLLASVHSVADPLITIHSRLLAFVHSMANQLITILSGLLASVHSVLLANPLITIHSGLLASVHSVADPLITIHSRLLAFVQGMANRLITILSGLLASVNTVIIAIHSGWTRYPFSIRGQRSQLTGLWTKCCWPTNCNKLGLTGLCT